MKTFHSAFGLALALVAGPALVGGLAHAADRAAAPAAAAATPKETQWADLVPKDWDPMKDMRDARTQMLSDGDPRTMQIMRQLREAWDNAPTNDKLENTAVRLPGYVVPLEEDDSGMKEFLLVPYFGACIHTPPPPANQIVHVIAQTPIKNLRSMDTVWVSGKLHTARTDSGMGASAYQINAAAVAPYTAPARR